MQSTQGFTDTEGPLARWAHGDLAEPRQTVETGSGTDRLLGMITQVRAAIPLTVAETAGHQSLPHALKSDPVAMASYQQCARAMALSRALDELEVWVLTMPEHDLMWWQIASGCIGQWIEGTPFHERWTPWQQKILDLYAGATVIKP